MRKVLTMLTCLAVTAWSAAAFAQTPDSAHKSTTAAHQTQPAHKNTATAHAATAHNNTPSTIAFRDVKLKNGLRVIISEDHSAPVYAIALTYNVGSRDEVAGRTGFAHLFEHMMFQGSGNIGKGEHMLLVEENGGIMNGSTNSDRTNYFEELPVNQLDLGLFLESDRMKSLAINQANLDNQRNAVQEERRLGIDNQPYGKTYEVIDETVYDNFAYKHSTIGSMADLNAANLDDVQKFFKTYYAPNNAVLTLIGDFKTDEVLAKVTKYFGDIPSQPAPAVPDMTEPKQTAERRAAVEDAFAPMPRLNIVYKTVPGNTPDAYALGMLADILAGGQSSRLYQKLVKEQQLAVNVAAFARQMRGTSTLQIVVVPRPGKDLAEIEKAVYDEIEAFTKQAPADWEIQKVLLTVKARRAQQLQMSLARAVMMGEFTVYYNEPNLINTLVDKYSAVTKDDLVRVAKTYMQPTNRSVITTVPKPKPAQSAQAGQ